MLSAGEIASMRSTVDSALPGTAVIQRVTLASDGQGGNTETWAAVGTVSCRVSPLPSGEQVTAGRMATHTTKRITVPANTSVLEQDRIVENSITYTVESVDDRNWELSRVCIATEID